jgi:hypothetical protein
MMKNLVVILTKAAANAAAFAVLLAEELIKEREHTAVHDGNNPNYGGVHNFSSGQVGIQAAHVTGSTVCMGAATPTPTAIPTVFLRQPTADERRYQVVMVIATPAPGQAGCCYQRLTRPVFNDLVENSVSP